MITLWIIFIGLCLLVVLMIKDTFFHEHEYITPDYIYDEAISADVRNPMIVTRPSGKFLLHIRICKHCGKVKTDFIRISRE